MSDGRATRFVAGAIGEPGERTFYVYVESDAGAEWYLLEKQQVAALGGQSLEAIDQMGLLPDEAVVENIVASQMDIPWPTEPDRIMFRVASMGLRLDEVSGLVIVILSDGESESAQFGVTSEQLRAMALYALREVQSGRPVCPKCHLPEEPEGHHCMSTNGHKPLG